MRSAFVHLASDALLALGVAVAGVVMMATGWWWLDPVVGIAISIVIVFGTWSILQRSLHLAVQGVPEHVEIEAVKRFLRGLPNVVDVHDLHVWGMSTTEAALTAHLVVPINECSPNFLNDVAKRLHHDFAIEHTTIQLEPPECPDPCVLASSERI